MSADLIPLYMHPIKETPIQTVNGRELHGFLAVKTPFADWIARRIKTYGFEEERDFTTLKSAPSSMSPIEYFVTLDMAKELSMVERTKKGKEARHYFLACEKAVLDQHRGTTLPATRGDLLVQMAEAYRLQERRLLEVEAAQQEQQQQLLEQQAALIASQRQALEAHQLSQSADANATRALESQQCYTVAEYVYFEKLTRQLPESAYKACSDHLRIYCMDNKIPFRKVLVGGKQWQDEYGFPISAWTEAFPGWLTRRFAQTDLRMVHTIGG